MAMNAGSTTMEFQLSYGDQHSTRVDLLRKRPSRGLGIRPIGILIGLRTSVLRFALSRTFRDYMEAFFEFEKPIVNLEKKLQDLRELAKQEGVDFGDEIKILEKKVAQLIDETYAKLTPWQKVQLSRHPGRPYTRDYVDLLFPDFMELHGDRTFGDDQAMLGGVATWPPAGVECDPEKRIPILILGHQKGRNTKQKMERNFGMVKPEGYRKAMRLMKLADRAKMPIITFIDTPGAYPGIEAEERGQAASHRRKHRAHVHAERSDASPSSSAKAARAARSESA